MVRELANKVVKQGGWQPKDIIIMVIVMSAIFGQDFVVDIARGWFGVSDPSTNAPAMMQSDRKLLLEIKESQDTFQSDLRYNMDMINADCWNGTMMDIYNKEFYDLLGINGMDFRFNLMPNTREIQRKNRPVLRWTASNDT